jgi:hypothetical protein
VSVNLESLPARKGSTDTELLLVYALDLGGLRFALFRLSWALVRQLDWLGVQELRYLLWQMKMEELPQRVR